MDKHLTRISEPSLEVYAAMESKCPKSLIEEVFRILHKRYIFYFAHARFRSDFSP